MIKRVVFLLVIVVATFAFAGCSASKKGEMQDRAKLEKFEFCGEMISVLSPFTNNSKKSSLYVEGATILSVEEMSSICAPGPCKTYGPMSEDDFFKYVEKTAKDCKGQAEKTGFFYEKNNYRLLVMTIKGGKGDRYFGQVHRNGQPCGVWEVEPF